MRLKILILLTALLPLRLVAQQPVAALASHYPGLSVILTTANGAKRFYIGQPIQLVLHFRASLPNRYNCSFGSSDRTVPVAPVVHFTPQNGWHDPMPMLHQIRWDEGCSSCPMGFGPLTAKQETQPLALNQWAHFDRPGIYTVVVETDAISLYEPDHPFGPRLPVLSSSLQLEIVAPPTGWRVAQLGRAKSMLRSAIADPASGDDGKLNAAMHALGSLGGPEAARLLAGLYFGSRGYNVTGLEAALGETGAPRTVLAAMQAAIDDPQQALNPRLLAETAIFLQVTSHTDFRLSYWQQADKQVMQKVAQALPEKQGSVLATSLAAALAFAPSDFPAAGRPWLTEELADHFRELSARQRNEVLSALASSEDPLAGPAELPFLRRAARLPLPGDITGEARAGVLHRWYDLAPTEARPAVIAAIIDHVANARDLGFLPDKVLPKPISLCLRPSAPRHPHPMVKPPPALSHVTLPPTLLSPLL